MEKLRIMILANDTTYVYNLRDELIERLVDDGYEVIVASRPLLFRDELKALGCRLIDIETDRHGKNPLNDLALLLKYIKILSQERPDVVLSYNIKPNVYGGMACRMTKTHYLPNITGLGKAVESPGLMQMISTRLYKLGIFGADCVFFQNEENRHFFKKNDLLREGCKTRLLPGSGVNLKIHQAMPYPKVDDKINILFVARIMREKGIDLYLDAATRIYDKHKKIMFHICGKCDDKKYIERLKSAEKKGNVIYHGEQKNIVPFFEMSHCIVHPSYYPEGMSNVLLEAAAHCRPIITTDRAGCRETIDKGKSGLIIPVKNADALVDALEDFLAMSWEQRRRMGLEGRAKIEREFDRQLVVKAYVEEIEKIGKPK